MSLTGPGYFLALFRAVAVKRSERKRLWLRRWFDNHFSTLHHHIIIAISRSVLWVLLPWKIPSLSFDSLSHKYKTFWNKIEAFWKHFESMSKHFAVKPKIQKCKWCWTACVRLGSLTKLQTQTSLSLPWFTTAFASHCFFFPLSSKATSNWGENIFCELGHWAMAAPVCTLNENLLPYN